MRFMKRIFGEEPEDGRSLYISLHGSGGVPDDVNDQQWWNQMLHCREKEFILHICINNAPSWLRLLFH